MANYRTVQQGECISSIAFEEGFFPDTIWDHPNNKALKKLREDPNILMQGDKVFVPDKRIKQVDKPTDKSHKFTMKGVPAKLRLQFLDNDNNPRANVPYKLLIDNVLVSAPGDRTNKKGMVICSIAPNAEEGALLLGEGEEMMEYNLVLGHLNPVDDISGVKQRLRNLGFYNGGANAELNDETKDAISAFQSLNKLKPTGELDKATLKKLSDAHDTA